jgi:uncharacterized membrane protein
MNQHEFMSSLEVALKERGVANVSDILNDYREHFTHGLSSGKTEEEIAAKLGQPTVIAGAYETKALIDQVRSTASDFQWQTSLEVIGRLIILAPFNFILLLLPGSFIAAALLFGWAGAVIIGSASVGFLAFASKAGLLVGSFWVLLGVTSTCLALLGIGVFVALLMFVITKYILLGLISYLQWNMKFVLNK